MKWFTLRFPEIVSQFHCTLVDPTGEIPGEWVGIRFFAGTSLCRTNPASSWRDPFCASTPIVGVTQSTGDTERVIGGRGCPRGVPRGVRTCHGGVGSPSQGGRVQLTGMGVRPLWIKIADRQKKFWDRPSGNEFYNHSWFTQRVL